MGNFKEVFLGQADSEKEAERNPELFIDSFFDPDNNIGELLDGDKYIVSGRKGDGKTAYSAKISLLEGKRDIYTAKKTLNNFNNITFEQLQTYQSLGGNPYISFWKCILMIEAIKLINEKQVHVSNDFFNTLVEALRVNGLLETDDIARTVTKLVETNTSFNLKSFFGRDSRKEHEKVLQGTEEIYLAVRKCIKNLYFGSSKHYLLVDGLDDILSVDNFEPKVLTGLIRACDEINSFFRKGTFFLKIIIFIRSDILTICRDPNITKILRDSKIELDWRIEDISEAASSRLIQLVKKRFDNVWEEEEDFMSIWNQIFQPIVDSKSSLEYVLDNIIYRPRDILQLMLEAQKVFVNGSRISENMIQTILYKYSNDYFVSAMQDELTGFFPDAVVTILPTVLSRIGQQFFDVKTFKQECDKHKEFVGVDAVELLKKMFNDGYIGQHRPKESKEYTVFKYRNPRETFIEDHECIVHRGLMRSLTIG